jgi:chromosomal replication initiation ATPase DnaA
MRNHIVSLGHDQLVLVAQRLGKGADQVEQTVASRCNVRAVLTVAIGPEALGRNVVTLVEQGVERFEHKRLVLFRGCLRHVAFLFDGSRADAVRCQIAVAALLPGRLGQSGLS